VELAYTWDNKFFNEFKFSLDIVVLWHFSLFDLFSLFYIMLGWLSLLSFSLMGSNTSPHLPYLIFKAGNIFLFLIGLNYIGFPLALSIGLAKATFNWYPINSLHFSSLDNSFKQFIASSLFSKLMKQ
jgi:hypothetical protein